MQHDFTIRLIGILKSDTLKGMLNYIEGLDSYGSSLKIAFFYTGRDLV